jgi:hypothetical protein
MSDSGFLLPDSAVPAAGHGDPSVRSNPTRNPEFNDSFLTLEKGNTETATSRGKRLSGLHLQKLLDNSVPVTKIQYQKEHLGKF